MSTDKETSPNTDGKAIEVIQLPEHVYLGRGLKDKIFNLRKTAPVKVIYSHYSEPKKTVTITGSDDEIVSELKMKIQSLVSSFKQPAPRRELSHFVAIPFNSQVVKDNFKTFKLKVLELCPDLEESLFQNPDKIHLTTGVMNITKEQEAKAKEVLTLAKDDIIKKIVGTDGQLKVSLEGVSILRDDPTKTKVVYAKINSEHLQSVANSLVKLFVDHKVMDPTLQSSADLSVKLHVTLMNTTFRTREFEKNRRKFKKGEEKRPPRPNWFFDSTPILEQFKDFVFATDLVVDQIHLSCFEKTVAEDGFYTALEKLQL